MFHKHSIDLVVSNTIEFTTEKKCLGRYKTVIAWLIDLRNGISMLVGYLMPKPSLSTDSQIWGNKTFHTFSLGY